MVAAVVAVAMREDANESVIFGYPSSNRKELMYQVWLRGVEGGGWLILSFKSLLNNAFFKYMFYLSFLYILKVNVKFLHSYWHIPFIVSVHRFCWRRSSAQFRKLVVLL